MAHRAKHLPLSSRRTTQRVAVARALAVNQQSCLRRTTETSTHGTVKRYGIAKELHAMRNDLHGYARRTFRQHAERAVHLLNASREIDSPE